MKRFVGLIVVCAIGVLLLAGCGGQGSQQPAAPPASPTPAPDPQAKQESLVVAIAGPMTGSCAQSGRDIERGVRMAVERINKAGGINGRQIEVVVEDDASDPKQAANVANKLSNDPKVLAVIGHYNSSCTLAGAPIYNRAGVVEVSPGSSAPAVTDAGPYTFRVIPTDAKSIYATIGQIHNSGVPILLVEQNAFLALTTAGRAYVIDTGRIVTSGDSASLMEDEQVKRAYLGG